jgi:hypothetical protein
VSQRKAHSVATAPATVATLIVVVKAPAAKPSVPLVASVPPATALKVPTLPSATSVALMNSKARTPASARESPTASVRSMVTALIPRRPVPPHGATVLVHLMAALHTPQHPMSIPAMVRKAMATVTRTTTAMVTMRAITAMAATTATDLPAMDLPPMAIPATELPARAATELPARAAMVATVMRATVMRATVMRATVMRATDLPAMDLPPMALPATELPARAATVLPARAAMAATVMRATATPTATLSETLLV